MKKEYSLFIDTTNNFCYVALYQATHLVKDTKLKVDKNVTNLIVDSINKLLIKAKIAKSALTHMCVNIGPGSFTGDKVGVIVAKAWKLIYPKLCIKTISSLLLQVKKRPAISIINAKSKKLYLAVYGKNKVDIKPCCIDEDKLNKYLSKYKKYQIYRDQVDTMYHNYVAHINDFKEVKSLDDLEPLYLKHPVK